MDHRARARWDDDTTFVLASVGSAIGFGNIWRFPMVAYTHGGGAFVLPYLLALGFVTLPMVVLEFALGQAFQRAHVQMIAKLSPRAVGTGCYAVLGTFFISQYYTALLAYVVVYFFASFQDPLPWAASDALAPNGTGAASASLVAAKLFFNETVQEASDSIERREGLVPRLALAYATIWLCTFLAARKGASSIGKTSKLLMPLPFVIILVFLIRGLTLSGAGDGVAALFTPQMALLAQPTTWTTAVSQILFSASAGLATLTTYASYSPTDAPIVRNAAIVCVTNSLFSLAAGTAVFSFVGHLAHETGEPLMEVVTAGPALAFEVFPVAISMLPLPQLWSVLFFAMLLNLGLPSAVSMTSPLCLAATEAIAPDRPTAVSAAIHLVGCLTGLIIYTSRAGPYWIHINDHFVPLFLTIAVALSECVVVSFAYGARRLVHQLPRRDQRFEAFWAVSWRVVLPVTLFVLLLLQIVHEAEEPFNGFPGWAVACGWMLSLGPMALVPLFAVYPSLGRRFDKADKAGSVEGSRGDGGCGGNGHHGRPAATAAVRASRRAHAPGAVAEFLGDDFLAEGGSTEMSELPNVVVVEDAAATSTTGRRASEEKKAYLQFA